MTEPLLDSFHLDAVSHQKAGAGMSEVMEPKRSETVIFDHYLKMLCNVVRGYQLSEAISAYETIISMVISVFKQI